MSYLPLINSLTAGTETVLPLWQKFFVGIRRDQGPYPALKGRKRWFSSKSSYLEELLPEGPNI